MEWFICRERISDNKHLPKNIQSIWAESGDILPKEAFLKEWGKKPLKFGGFKMVYVQCFIKEKNK